MSKNSLDWFDNEPMLDHLLEQDTLSGKTYGSDGWEVTRVFGVPPVIIEREVPVEVRYRRQWFGVDWFTVILIWLAACVIGACLGVFAAGYRFDLETFLGFVEDHG